MRDEAEVRAALEGLEVMIEHADEEDLPVLNVLANALQWTLGQRPDSNLARLLGALPEVLAMCDPENDG